MKFTPIVLTAVAAAATSLSMPAWAAESTVGVATISCDASVIQDGQVVSNWQKLPEDKQARLAILRSALTPKADRATCIISSGAGTLPSVPSTLPNGTPALTQITLIQEILIVLNENPQANAAIIASILDQYGDQLAAAASDVEPAAGDEGTDVTFGDEGGDEGGENPNQLNTPTDETPAASPVTPPAEELPPVEEETPPVEELESL